MPSPAAAANDEGAALDALVRARLAEEAGAPASALSALTALASHVPQLPGLRVRMLEQAIEAGDLDAARDAATLLWQRGDRRIDTQLVLVVDAMRRSDWKAARVYLAGRTGAAGGDAISRLIQPAFSAWIDVGAREKGAERHLLAAVGRGRPEPALAIEGALVQLASGRAGDARLLSDNIVLTDRTSQLVALRLAATLEKAGDTGAAARLRKRIALAAGTREDPLLLLPDQPVSTPREGAAHWLALLADGLSRLPNGNPQVPLLFARSAFWLNDRDWTARTALVESLSDSGQAQAAMALIDQTRGAVPPVLEMRRAELLADTSDIAGAVALADTAASHPPPERSLLIRYADLARRSDDPQAAARAFSRLEATLGMEDGDQALRGMLLVARAQLKLEADDWDAAQPLMEQAVALRPNDAAVLNFAGYSAIERRKDIAQSLERIEAAWKEEPQSPAITDSLGWAYFLTGRADDAVPLLEKAQLGDPENAVIVEHLGDAYWHVGRKFQARYSWRAAALLADAEMATRLEAKLRDGLTPLTTAP